jgi:hypothetical protein
MLLTDETAAALLATPGPDNSYWRNPFLTVHLCLMLLLCVLGYAAAAASQQAQLLHQQWCAFGTDVAGTNL